MCDTTCNEEQCSKRDKILHCACELFANRGFKSTTIQDICAHADANIASVNYYFGTKEGVYCASWEYALDISQTLGGRIDDTLPAQEWLERAIEQRIKAIFSDGPGGWLPKLIHNEHQDRSHMPEDLKHKVLKHFHTRVAKKISQYLDKKLPENQLFAITGFVLGLMPGLLFLRHQKYPDNTITETELNTLISTAKAYIFGGLNELKARLNP